MQIHRSVVRSVFLSNKLIMINTIITTKSHMTQAWDKNGKRLAVTVSKAQPLVVTKIKTADSDGYKAVQIGVGTQKLHRVNKPQQIALKKAKITATPRFYKEVSVQDDSQLQVGDTISFDTVIATGDRVNVQSTSKGRGFAGVMKRWRFKGGPRTHGQSDRARAPGSIGQGTDPGRIHKGKKMPGHYGHETITLEDMTVINVDADKQQIWVNGPIPGHTGAYVSLTKTGQSKFIGLQSSDSDESPTDKPEATTKAEDPTDTSSQSVADAAPKSEPATPPSKDTSNTKEASTK